MRWLLITTKENRNTGDELIRIGVQNLIKEVDKNPQFILLDKEKWTPEEIEFDRCILCGMPMFWNNEVSTSQTIGWWEALMNGYVSRTKKRFLILGAGDVVGKHGLKDEAMFHQAIQQAIDKSFAVTTRNYISDNPKLINSICPAAFAITKPGVSKLKLCNFMTDGAHDSHFDPEEAEIWRGKIQEMSDYCRANDFWFVEHSRPDHSPRYEDGKSLGWTYDRIFCFEKAEEYLPVYANAGFFVGNRLHGAVLLAAMGRPSLAIGYESRLKMVMAIGGEVRLPSEVSVKDIQRVESQLMANEYTVPVKVWEERRKMINILNEFIR